MTAFLDWVSFLLILVTSSGLLLSRDWHRSLVFLSVQYLGAFWLVQTVWGVPMAAVKLVAGWMACAVLGLAFLNTRQPVEEFSSWTQARSFRLMASAMVILATYAAAHGLESWIGLSLQVTWGALMLAGMGLLQLGLSARPARVVIGLLTLLSGFEILYASVESSALIAALLVLINLGLAMVGAYFLLSGSEEAV